MEVRTVVGARSSVGALAKLATAEILQKIAARFGEPAPQYCVLGGEPSAEVEWRTCLSGFTRHICA